MSEKVWSEYQKKIFRDFKGGSGNTVVDAKAGSGKTSTAVQGLKYVPKRWDVMLCAFNKSIQRELESRVPRGHNVRTLHSIGYGLLMKHLDDKPTLEQYNGKTRHIARDVMKERGLEPTKERLGAVAKLVNMGKNVLVDDVLGLIEVAYDFGLDEKDFPAPEMAPIAADTMKRSLDMTSVIEFTDMIWFPYKFGWAPKEYDLVVVDEAQDLNACQIWMVQKMAACDDGGRLIAIGDVFQAIYGWRGADTGAMNRIVAGFGAKTLTLPMSYRCPKSVVRLAQKYVPDFQWWDQAPEGTVEEINDRQMAEMIKPGDFLLSRTNAPLVKWCLRFIGQKIPAVIAGRDIGAQLASLVKKSETTDTAELDIWLQEYLWNERERLTKAGREEALGLIEDKVEAIQIFMEGEREVKRVIQKIENLFVDDDPYTKIVCSTVHRAKGLERANVYLLQDTFRRLDVQEEKNVYYVAITRAQQELYLVHSA